MTAHVIDAVEIVNVFYGGRDYEALFRAGDDEGLVAGPSKVGEARPACGLGVDDTIDPIPDNEVKSAARGKHMPALGEKEWQEHAALIGVVNLAWNQTVHQLLRVFCHLTGLESPLAEAIFFSPQSDSAQRNLVKRVAAAVGLAEQNWKTLEELLSGLKRPHAAATSPPI
ncbi:hypothetical protein [Rhizobium laguerreae]|uniref:hypothetical protein n=1 Tax=Rhizobium laguerreae TaxID=1076926 RepID=UPI001C8FAC61|nr:hypothetical protein [Rhizobium laguerreae]